MDPKERLIFALDFSRLEDALPLVKELAPYVGIFKVGLEVLTGAGAPRVVDEIQKRGGKVFLDGKFHDIPNTVAKAAEAAAALGVYFFDVHASSGKEALKQAAEKKGKSRLLAVTVLTSLGGDECQEIYGDVVEKKVVAFAEMARDCGADGVVCSAHELDLLRNAGLTNLFRVVPGIRPSWAGTQDQKRVVTPGEAIRLGATHLVVGRPIASPPASIGSRVEATKKILKEIEDAL